MEFKPFFTHLTIAFLARSKMSYYYGLSLGEIIDFNGLQKVLGFPGPKILQKKITKFQFSRCFWSLIADRKKKC